MNAKHTGATKLPNQPKMSATDLKKAFDAPSKDVIAPKFNGLIDELEASTAAINIGAVTPAGVRTTIQETLNAKGDMKSDDYDAESKVIDAGGIVAYVSAAIVSKASISTLADVAFSGEYSDLENTPTELADFTDDSTHRLVTDAEKAGWDAKADTTDIPTSLSELSDDSTHRVVTDTEKSTWNDKLNNDGSNASSLIHFNALTVGGRQGTVGMSSFAQGFYVTASGDRSTALGTTTSATGLGAVAEGVSSTASGRYSHAEGSSTVAGYKYQHVLGVLNNNKTDTLFEIGNGSATEDEPPVITQQNAFEVYRDGTISQDDGATKYKFTSYNGTDGYYDKNGTFHALGGAGTGDMKASDYDADEAVKLAGGIKAYVSSQISSAMVGVMGVSDYDPNSAVANAGGIDRYVASQISTAITSALTASY